MEPESSSDPRAHPDFHNIFDALLDTLREDGFVDPDEVREQHPELASALLEDLETYVTLRPEPSQAVTLGDYTLRRQLGRGGMGIVYEAWEHSMDRAVALKVLPAAVAADERSLQRFVREAKTAAQLHHPGVVHVYGMGVKDATPYYAMLTGQSPRRFRLL